MGAYISTDSNVEFEKELRPYDLIREVERITAKKRTHSATTIDRENVFSQTSYILIEDLKSGGEEEKREAAVNTKRIRIIEILKMRDGEDRISIRGGKSLNYEENYDEVNFNDTIGKHEKLEISMHVVDNEVVPKFEETVYGQDPYKKTWDEDNDDWEAVDAGNTSSNKKYVVEKKTILRKFKKESVRNEETETETENIFDGRIGGLRKKEIIGDVRVITTREEKYQPAVTNNTEKRVVTRIINSGNEYHEEIGNSRTTKRTGGLKVETIVDPPVVLPQPVSNTTTTTTTTIVNNVPTPEVSKNVTVRKVIVVQRDNELTESSYTQRNPIISNIKEERTVIHKPTINIDTSNERINISRSGKIVTPQKETSSTKIISSRIIPASDKKEVTTNVTVRENVVAPAITTTTVTKEEIRLPTPSNEAKNYEIKKRVIKSGGSTTTNTTTTTTNNYTGRISVIQPPQPQSTITQRTVITKEDNVREPSSLQTITQRINKVVKPEMLINYYDSNTTTKNIIVAPTKIEDSRTTTTVTKTITTPKNVVVRPTVQETRTVVSQDKTIVGGSTRVVVKPRDKSIWDEENLILASRSGKTSTTTTVVTNNNVIKPVENRTIKTININRGDFSSSTTSTVNVFEGKKTINVIPTPKVETTYSDNSTIYKRQRIDYNSNPFQSSTSSTTTTTTIVGGNTIAKRKHYDFSREVENQVTFYEGITKSKSSKQVKTNTNRTVTSNLNILRETGQIKVRSGNVSSKGRIENTTTITNVTTNKTIDDSYIKRNVIVRPNGYIREVIASSPTNNFNDNRSQLITYGDVTTKDFVVKKTDYNEQLTDGYFNSIRTKRSIETDVGDENIRSVRTNKRIVDIKKETTIKAPTNITVDKYYEEHNLSEAQRKDSHLGADRRTSTIITTTTVITKNADGKEVVETNEQREVVDGALPEGENVTTTTYVLEDGKTVSEKVETSPSRRNDTITVNAYGRPNYGHNNTYDQTITTTKQTDEIDKQNVNVDRKAFNAQAFLGVLEMMKQKK
jgi:hypothetical protein